MAVRRLAVALLPIVFGLAVLARADHRPSPAPPPQPADGPGGAAAAHRSVVARRYGSGATAYWLFEPAEPSPKSAPLVVFLHGWSAMQPAPYGAWIDHVVKRGHVVVYPLYQSGLRTPVSDFTANALAGVRAALEKLGQHGHVHADVERCAVVGHSMGGALAANLATRWKDAGIPRPRAIMSVEPGKTWARSDRVAVRLDDLSRVDPDTLVLTVAGDHDGLARDVDATRIFRETTRVPPENKSYIEVVSDDHGTPALVASHFFPLAGNSRYLDPAGDALPAWLRDRLLQRRARRDDPNRTARAAAIAAAPDALDFFGTWKWLDALLDAVSEGKSRQYALGNTPEQRFMGRWSDGVAVKEPRVRSAPR